MVMKVKEQNIHLQGIERYLQLCANDNMYAANCTTPSNLFHILRRQMVTSFRKPLILLLQKVY